MSKKSPKIKYWTVIHLLGNTLSKSIISAEEFEEGDDTLSFKADEEVIHIIKNWCSVYRITMEEAILLDKEALESEDKRLNLPLE